MAPGHFFPGSQYISDHLAEPSCQQEQHEMTEVAAAVFPDLAVQVLDEPGKDGGQVLLFAFSRFPTVR